MEDNEKSFPDTDIVNFRNKIINDLNHTPDRYNISQISKYKGLHELEYFPIDTVYEIIDEAFIEYIKNKEKV